MRCPPRDLPTRSGLRNRYQCVGANPSEISERMLRGTLSGRDYIASRPHESNDVVVRATIRRRRVVSGSDPRLVSRHALVPFGMNCSGNPHALAILEGLSP